MINHLDILKYIPFISKEIDDYAINRVIEISNNIFKYQSYREYTDIIKLTAIGIGAEIQFCNDINIDILKQPSTNNYHDFNIKGLKVEVKHVTLKNLNNDDSFLVVSRDAARNKNIQINIAKNITSNKVYSDSWHLMCIYTSVEVNNKLEYKLQHILDWHTYKSNYGSLVNYSKRKDKNNEIYVHKKLLYKCDNLKTDLYTYFFKILAKALANQISNPVKKSIIIEPLLPFNI